jgi:hypothetical protein
MPWKPKDVRRHNKAAARSKHSRKKWSQIANAVRKSYLARGEDPSKADVLAIRTANARLKTESLLVRSPLLFAEAYVSPEAEKSKAHGAAAAGKLIDPTLAGLHELLVARAAATGDPRHELLAQLFAKQLKRSSAGQPPLGKPRRKS